MKEYIKGYDYIDQNGENDKIERAQEKSNEQEVPPKGYRGVPLLIIIQIIVCIIVIGSVIVIKTFSPSLYNKFSLWYNDKINDSLIVGDNVDECIESFNKLISENIEIDFKRLSLITHSKEGVPLYITTNLQRPVSNGIMTSGFGKREDPISGKKDYHYGIDIACDENSEIKAVLNGKVEMACQNSSYGKYIIIDHGNNIKSLYAHCNDIKVKVEDNVKRNQVIALAGNTGESTGNHLHLELIVLDKKYDPFPLLNGTYEM